MLPGTPEGLGAAAVVELPWKRGTSSAVMQSGGVQVGGGVLDGGDGSGTGVVAWDTGGQQA